MSGRDHGHADAALAADDGQQQTLLTASAVTRALTALMAIAVMWTVVWLAAR
jgi:hypothetical protein